MLLPPLSLEEDWGEGGGASPIHTMTSPRAITSRDNPLLVKIRKFVRDGAAYRKLGQLWIEGEHLCEAWVARGRPVAHAIVVDDAWGSGSKLRMLTTTVQQISMVPIALMKELSTLESPASVAFLVDQPLLSGIASCLPSVVLDRLQDAGNVGSILRSAAAFGFEQVIAMKGTVALWSPKVLRAGMGAHFGLQIIEGVASHDALSALHLPLIGTSSHASETLYHAHLPWPCAWVIGHEGQGICDALFKRFTTTVCIPQPGGQESLNAAAAAAVCLYESLRQRG